MDSVLMAVSHKAYMERRHNKLKTLFEERQQRTGFRLKRQKLSRTSPILAEPHNQIEGDIPWSS